MRLLLKQMRQLLSKSGFWGIFAEKGLNKSAIYKLKMAIAYCVAIAIHYCIFKLVTDL